ncbi:Fic family protein [Gelidibacter pelagius]|uniref:Fic family protein n=1 Tax=Gelidibacter pelagius TaxID=2819985 RepID=UPI001F15E2C9|nr:ATP-binding protein [Gelidibacter pelagius]
MAPKFELFDNRLEITSNGGLPDWLSKDEFFEGFSIPRNKELMRIFKDLDLVEQLGSGIPRILQVYDKDVFQFSDNFLRIVLPASESSASHSTEQVTEQGAEQVTEQVLTLIRVMDNEKHSRLELMELVGIKHRPTFLYNYLQPSIEAGLVALTIPDKPTSGNQKYYLTEKGKAFIKL